jgi:hypothetical protein
MAKKPTQAQIRAVHHALYKRNRLHELKHRLADIRRTMNFNPTAPLSPHDIRNPPGSGPNWFIEATGAIDRPVLEAATLCDKIAEGILEMRHDVAAVDFPADDKHHLMTALKEEAASWTARGKAWRSPDASNIDGQVNAILAHVTASVQAAKHVQRYLKPAKDFGL